MRFHLLFAGLLTSGFLLPSSLQAQRLEYQESHVARPSSPAANENDKSAAHEPSSAASNPNRDRVKELITQSTNRFRREHGRRLLREHSKLMRDAQEFADFMARTDRYGHEADGRTPAERARAAGYEYSIIAENIAYAYDSEGFSTRELAREFIKGWEHSPPHRKNMLDADVSDFGVGVAHSARTGRYYAVQEFGRPKAKMITFRITNDSDLTVHYDVAGQSYTIQPRYTMTHELPRPSRLEFEERQRNERFRPQTGDHFIISNNGENDYRITEEK